MFARLCLLAVICLQAGCITVNLIEPSGPVKEVQLSGTGDGKVLLLDLSGVISSQDKEGLVPQPNMLATFKEELTRASKDDKIKAVVVRINSPGGTVTASDILYHELRDFKTKKKVPVIVSMMDVAASGGYYLAMAADSILVHPSTVTGSIGVIMLTVNARGLLEKVGVEPTGEAFNAIVLDEKSNRPLNPLVNAGAIATADLIRGKDFSDRIKLTLAMFGRYIGRELYIDNAIFLSERTTGHRNRAISHLMLNFGMVSDQIPDSLELYFQQCSILVNAHDLAVMGATLANAGVNPVTKERALDRQYVKDVLSVMLTCGMYDYAGEWAYRVGLPAKSGVGGGICAVVPGRGGIGIFSPLLDPRGNSVRGIKVCEELSDRFGLHSFELGFGGPSLEDEFQLRRSR